MATKAPYFPCPECNGRTIPSKLPNMVKCSKCGKLSILPMDWRGIEEKLGPDNTVADPGLDFDSFELEVPDYSEVMVGWRAWGIPVEAADELSGVEPRLYSVTYTNLYWPPREKVEAICSKHEHHVPPVESCSCGFYTAKTRKHLMSMTYHKYDAEKNNMFHVVGTVSLWGGLREGTQGWRSQYSYPRELFVPFEAWKLAVPLRDAYGIPVQLNNILRPE